MTLEECREAMLTSQRVRILGNGMGHQLGVIHSVDISSTYGFLDALVMVHRVERTADGRLITVTQHVLPSSLELASNEPAKKSAPPLSRGLSLARSKRLMRI